MLPAPQSALHSRYRRSLSWCTGAAVVALLAVHGPHAYAQTAAVPPPETVAAGPQSTDTDRIGPPVTDPLMRAVPSAPAPTEPVPASAADENIAFEADKLEYNDNDQTVLASGNVVLRRLAQSLRADTVTWNRTSGRIFAVGNIRIVDEDGNQLFTDKVELTEELKAGAMENMLLALREGGRIAARSGTRDASGNVVLTQAAYTGCDVEDSGGCPKKPSWRVTAGTVTYDSTGKTIRFRNARLELFGFVRIPLPGLAISTDGRATSGVLIPDIGYTRSNGVQLSGTYYYRLAPNRDIAGTAYVFTQAPPMVSGQYRALTDIGAYQITGYATASKRVPDSSTTGARTHDFRGYLFANGKFQLSPNWSVTGSTRVVTDRTFLRRYDISRDDRLRSIVEVERIDDDSYLSIAGYATQTLRIGVSQGQVPIALPVIDYRRRLADPLLGGRIELQANTMAILRTSGQDTQRAFAGARWDLRKLTSLGQEVTFTALVRGDVYHSDENDLTSTLIYRGNSGWEARGVATAAVDVKWPLTGPLLGGNQILTPRFQVVASPAVRNLAIPNEDGRAIDLEDSNLFALTRFPGYDRIEDGVRFTYGLDWQFERPRWRILSTIGQSYRLTSEPTLLPDGTGLSNRTSDIVGRTELRYRDFLKLTHRFRLDKDTLGIRRNEIDATVGSRRTYAEIGYLRLNRDITTALEDLQDREEVRVAGRVAFARYWSVFGSGVVNLTDRREDPTSLSDGFEPLRTRLGVAYEDDCLELSLTWRRDFVTNGDARKGNNFALRFALRNLGFRR